MPSTICRTMTTRKYIPPPPRRSSSERVTTDGDHAREEHHERVHDALQQRHRHHVAVGDVRDFVGEDALDFLGSHRPQADPLDTATRLRLLLGPVANALTSADS